MWVEAMEDKIGWRRDNVEIEGAGEPPRAHMAPPGVWGADGGARGWLEEGYRGS